MRLCIVGAALLSSIATTGAAQSRWTISAGPELTRWWSTQVWGMRLRAEYDVIRPTSVFGLRLEGAARWGPTQGFSCECPGFTVHGNLQRSDVMLGISGSIAPFARSRFSPYATIGVFGRRLWEQGAFFMRDSMTVGDIDVPHYSYTPDDIVGTLGMGMRARLAGRSFQLELRRVYDSRGLTFGARLPF